MLTRQPCGAWSVETRSPEPKPDKRAKHRTRRSWPRRPGASSPLPPAHRHPDGSSLSLFRYPQLKSDIEKFTKITAKCKMGFGPLWRARAICARLEGRQPNGRVAKWRQGARQFALVHSRLRHVGCTGTDRNCSYPGFAPFAARWRRYCAGCNSAASNRRRVSGTEVREP